MIDILDTELDLDGILRDTKPRGVIYAGAHLGTSRWIFQKNGIETLCWIEANPDVFYKLEWNVPPKDEVINVAVCDKDELLTFHVTNNEQSSSLYKLKKHAEVYPGIVETSTVTVNGIRLDTLIKQRRIKIENYNFLFMDLQGGEYYALKGFEENISKIDYIYAEVNYEELYEGCMLVDDFDKYLSVLGFKKVCANRHGSFAWGDAFYKRV